MTTEIVAVNVPRGLAALASNAPAVFLPNPKTAERLFEFFTANIRNKNTRRAYYKAVCRFAAWCEGRGLHDLVGIKPLNVAGYIEDLADELAKPTVKQHLAALRMLFDWLVVGHVLDSNPAHAVRGPKHVVKKRTEDVPRPCQGQASYHEAGTSQTAGSRRRPAVPAICQSDPRTGLIARM
jgi:integrase/recombinase XerD